MVQQYKAFWSVPNAGACVTTFHSDATLAGQAQSFADRVRTFMAAFSGFIPDECAITFDTEVTWLDTATGQLEEVTAVTAPDIVTGSASGTWAAGSGCRVVWSTSSIVNGRRVRGATFMVPMASIGYASSGRIAATLKTAAEDAAVALLSGAGGDGWDLQVYSRPAPGRPGSAHSVDAGSCSEMVATLRGRKY